MTRMTIRAVLLFLWVGTSQALAGKATVAVAANFLVTAEVLAAAFGAGTGHEVALVPGSTGKLYAQIVAGAPFDVFLSADVERPAALVAKAQTAGDARPYAFGKLALVQLGSDPVTIEALRRTDRRIAIADPAVAPYGIAAREVLRAIRGAEWDANLVYGESVGQAFAFVATGNAPIGLVALSQTRDSPVSLAVTEVPGNMYAPIRQDAVLLARAAGNPAARAFLDYLAGEEARSIIARAGYGVVP